MTTETSTTEHGGETCAPDCKVCAEEIAERKARAKQLAQHFVERSAAQGYKGRRRDVMAVEFFVGALAGAHVAGDDTLAQHYSLLAHLVTIRGYSEVEHWANKE